jgi:hypothetical protein
MRKQLVRIFVGLMLAMPTFAQTTSQVSATVNAQFLSLSLSSPSSLYTNTFLLNYVPLVNGTLSYGVNGAGVANANQLFIGQYLITNGALSGTNYINLNTMSNAGTGILVSDPVGNAYSIRNIKSIVVQNAGLVSGNNNETNMLIFENVPGAIGWTNNYGLANLTLTIPSPGTNATVSNTPTSFNWNGGDIGWPVLAATDNTIVLTNPNPGTVLKANIYVIGSTGQ